ncbi:alpha/beta fold hydrolase [Streptomyces sp. B1866]|uniref:thioesterase II family protein n=1 Tax=Streptomyces sp. B1866 TaxID=3075431 RepID=UPI00288CE987|nr:alpha/beta fold hydrolase [Streptomyces sp. B1866]MDT3397641.1 alpha/beta fold hydrolase [Streptomyces sp. B1866]
MTVPQQDSALWVRQFHPAADAKVRLVCLPHAGGSAPFFFQLSRALSPEVDVLSIQYPGRQDRRDEQPIDDLNVLVDRLFPVLRERADRPLVLMGHSMGAVLAYELARRFEAADAAPLGLIASGRRAPSVPRDENAHTLGDDAFIAEIRSLSGTAASLLEDDELIRMILPALRADYKAIETHQPAPEPRLRCPVGVLTGESDPRVSLDEASAWRAHTTGGFHFRSFTGGHFYLNDHQAGVAASVSEFIAAFTKEAASG